jgi:hypothetical protein
MKKTSRKIHLNVSVDKRSLYTVLSLLIVFAAAMGVYAYGTQNPSVFGHSAKELDFSQGVEGNAVFLGNVDVAGGLKLGTVSSCGSGNEGSLRYNSGSKKLELCNASSWSQVTGAASGLPFYGTSHTKEQCQAADGTVADFETNSFCRFIGSSCPAGWTRYSLLGSTSPRYCDGGSCGSGCTTGSHYFTNKSTENCTYYPASIVSTRDPDSGQLVPPYSTCGDASTQTCTANLIEVGCY